MEKLKYLQYPIFVIALILAVIVGHGWGKKSVSHTGVKQVVQQPPFNNDSLALVIQTLQDSLNQKVKHDTIYIKQQHIVEVNRILDMPIDSAVSYFSKYTSFLLGN